MKKFLLLLVLVLPSILKAQEPIEGAFGVKLGDSFDPAKAIGKHALTDGTPMYKIAANPPFKSFSEYYVLITPTTHRIYSIWAMGEFPAREAAINEQAVVLELLSKKYGEPKKKGSFAASMKEAKVIGSADRYITVLVEGFTNGRLEARYYDKALEAVAEKERIAIEASKADASGL